MDKETFKNVRDFVQNELGVIFRGIALGDVGKISFGAFGVFYCELSDIEAEISKKVPFGATGEFWGYGQMTTGGVFIINHFDFEEIRDSNNPPF